VLYTVNAFAQLRARQSCDFGTQHLVERSIASPSQQIADSDKILLWTYASRQKILTFTYYHGPLPSNLNFLSI
jgi:hypothetical protein